MGKDASFTFLFLWDLPTLIRAGRYNSNKETIESNTSEQSGSFCHHILSEQVVYVQEINRRNDPHVIPNGPDVHSNN